MDLIVDTHSAHDSIDDDQDVKPIKSGVSSNAVVKYSNIDVPVMFATLDEKTNLNEPPTNWLYGNSKWETNLRNFCFRSINMANTFLDMTGDVDVISDSENIKKLLKLSYSTAPVSMMIHRVANSILLDDFDIHKYLLRKQREEWKWFRTFFFECIIREQQESQEKFIVKKDRSVDFLKTRNMLSKFLYRSLQDEHSMCVEKSRSKAEGPLTVRGESAETARSDTGYERTVHWTFEDLTMLVGTNLPIFGSGVHPCVSLHLRDMKQPISVLTGLDYWLDNLMCNVPELAMCYHLDGIVQNYELIKTEDIPDMEGSKFSPQLVKNVATNILAFIKSKATKEGHTYWLVKGDNDDVVKLYDLTTLCSEYMTHNDSNPFTVPVGVLLYRLARNIRQTDNNNAATALRLLENALLLLDEEKHSQIVTSTHLMLSELCVQHQAITPDSSKPKNDPPSCDVTVQSLCLREHFAPAPPSLTLNECTKEERCSRALGHVVRGLHCLQRSQQLQSAGERHLVEDQAWCNPDEAIPLGYRCLAAGDPVIKDHEDLALCCTDSVTWQRLSRSLLYTRAAIICISIAEEKLAAGTHASGLRIVNLGILCYNAVAVLCPQRASKAAKIANSLYGLAGDLLVLLAGHIEAIDQLEEIYTSYSELEHSLHYSATQELGNSEYTCTTELSSEQPVLLERALAAYQKAEALHNSEATESCKKHALLRRQANVMNELGVQKMNLVVQQHQLEKARVVETLNESKKYLDSALEAFDQVEDKVNMALIRTNLGRWYRIQARIVAGDSGPVTEKERFMLTMAAKSYAETISLIESDNVKANQQQTDLSGLEHGARWELSKTCYHHASLLQDRELQVHVEPKQLQRDVIDLMNNALKFSPIPVCSNCDNGGCDACAKYAAQRNHVANIHHRLASLYHKSLRSETHGEQRKRHLRSLAELHYAHACRYVTSSRPYDQLRIELERLALAEYLANGQVGRGVRMRLLTTALQSACNCTTSVESLMTSQGEQEAEAEGLKLVQLLGDKVTSILHQMVKSTMNKKARNGECVSHETYKSQYALALTTLGSRVTLSNDKPELYQRAESLLSVLRQLASLFGSATLSASGVSTSAL